MMNNATIVEGRTTPGIQPGNGGAIPASSLHFRTGRLDEASELVLRHHYSKRVPGSVVMVGSLHFDGGLFGGDGEIAAAAFFSSPPTRWCEQVIELTRLVRAHDKVPLSLLISLCAKELKKRGHDLCVSFADRTQGHEGYVYRAANWHYAGCRDRAMDGLVINGTFVPGRTCVAKFGTRSPDKVKQMFSHFSVEPHYDEGKHLYWLSLGKRGKEKAQVLGLVDLS